MGNPFLHSYQSSDTNQLKELREYRGNVKPDITSGVFHHVVAEMFVMNDITTTVSGIYSDMFRSRNSIISEDQNQ